MSWFDKLFGEQSNDTHQQREDEVMIKPREEDNHDEIYRRPKGRFRFPIDVETGTEKEAEAKPESAHPVQSDFVNDDYFNSRRERRKRHHQQHDEPPHPLTERYHPAYTPPPSKTDIHKPKFVASEVPSAIYGTRKNLKPGESKVVITPLTGRKPEMVKPVTPPHRRQDNMVNVENVYASQIVAEIRREREKKAQAKKAFEEKRQQLKLQKELEEKLMTAPEQETPDTETVYSSAPEQETPDTETVYSSAPEQEMPDTETVYSSAPEQETPDTETVYSSAPEQETPDTGTVYSSAPEQETPDTETVYSSAPEQETPDTGTVYSSELETESLVLQPVHELMPELETVEVILPPAENSAVEALVRETSAVSHVNDSIDEAVDEMKEPILRPVVTKTRPFNVVMTPSDKKRLMDKKQAVTEPSIVEKIIDKITPDSADGSSAEPSLLEKAIDFVTPGHIEQEAPAVMEKVKEVVTGKDKKRKGPNYLLPPVSLLAHPEAPAASHEWVEEQRAQLDEALYHFNVPAKVEHVVVGPSVTRYELSVEKGVKVSRITNLQDDIKMALAAKDIRIEAPIPGTSRVGVEVPNLETRPVNLSEVIFSKRFKFAESKLMVALGVKINNEPMLMDIAKMPHALIAGATGSGKSVSINAILLSLLYRNNPSELKLLLIDPKMVELAPYNDLPHLLAPVITDVKAATESLKWIVEEMERRYKTFADVHVRNITAYNQKSTYDKRLPKIVIIIDELADLMMMAPQEVEHSIARIAQKARAAGIHMILATQRPSVNVITGLIKANVPTRIAFMVSSAVDSRTVMDSGGAEKLLGNGDMLYQGNGMNRPIRIQGCYVSDEEIDEVAAYIREQGPPNYMFKQEELLSKVNELPQDELIDDVIDYMQEEGQISTSQLQRRFQIGYNRAARIVDSLEDAGYISGANGSKPRTVLIAEKQQ
ncbi:DNA translocase FtsK [Macrococcus equipercicus]|uniref:DNA translocase FtsK n=1 Tax=Macrococcus equipercicus TaxID=69967 RepID=A0ABQ6R7E7_9STAP|nr:DNA translocase FtsK [Macrococcus equipercicus]KAA1038409.1 DNA translocase FtsK [Macrococcus equipercicus]